MACIGDDDEKDTMWSVVTAVVGNELSCTCKWRGNKGKKALKDLQLPQVIYGEQ
jgi:hypothetical protein